MRPVLLKLKQHHEGLGEPPWGDERRSQVTGTRRAQKGMSERRSSWRPQGDWGVEPA